MLMVEVGIEQCKAPPLRVLHVSSCSVQNTCRSSVIGLLRVPIIRRSVFLVQLGPVRGTNICISRKSGIVREECSVLSEL